MFNSATAFNQDIGRWNTANATNMTKMFRTASAFNQDLSGWCVPNISSLPDNFKTQSPLSDDNTPVWGACPSPSVSPTHSLLPQGLIRQMDLKPLPFLLNFQHRCLQHQLFHISDVVSNTAMTRVTSSTWSYTMNTNGNNHRFFHNSNSVGTSSLGRTYVGTETFVNLH